MTKARGLLIVGLLLCAKPSFAGVISLDGVDWWTTGIVSVVQGTMDLPTLPGPTVTVGPTGDNADWALLNSGDPSPTGPLGEPLAPGNVSAGDLEGFFGMSTGFLTNQNFVSGSGMKTSFSLVTNDTLTFDFSFVTSDPVYDDAAIFVMNKLGDVIMSGVIMSAGQLGGAVGTQVLNFGGPLLPGDYTIGLAVLNETDDVFQSYLGVDNFKINGAPLEGLEGQPVPEPGTLLLLTAGWGTAFVSRRFFGAPKKRVA